MAGSAVIGALRVNLGIDTAVFEKGLSRARKSLAKTGAQMQSIGTAMSVGLTAPTVAFGVSVAQTAGNFEAAMNKVGAVTSATSDEMAALSEKAKTLGRTTQFSASEAADAMGFLGMAGFSTTQILASMEGTLQLASAAQIDLATAADIVSNVLSGYGMQVEDLSRVNDVLVKTLTRTNTDLQQLGEAMKYAGPVASAAGVRFEEAAAAIGLMGNAGIQASMAGTSLRGAIGRILAPTSQMRKAMESAGLEFTDANGRILELSEIIQRLEPHADDAGLMMELFGQRAGPAMAALVSQGSSALVTLTQQLDDAGGTAERIATAQMQGLNGQMKALASAFEGLKLAIAESGFLEFVTQAVAQLTTFVQSLAKTSPEVLKWGTILAGLAVTLGPVVLAIGAVALVLSAISLPVLAAIGAVAALGGVFLAFRQEITAALGAAWAAISATLGPPFLALAEAFRAAIRNVGDLLREVFGEGTVGIIGRAASAVRDFFRIIAEAVANQLLANIAASITALTAVVETFAGVVQAVTQILRGDFQGALDTLVETAVNLKDRLAEAFRAMIGPIQQAAAEIAQAIIDAFSEIPARMFEVGKQIVQGLINGILSMGSAVRGAVVGIAQRAVEAIKSQLGIQSPSKVMHQIGVQTMQGYRDGLASMQQQVGSVAEQTAARVQAAISMVQGAGDPWAGLRDSTQSATDALGNMGNMGQSIGSAIGGAFKGLIDGSKTAAEALRDVIGQLAQLLLNQAFQSLFGGSSGAVSGFGGLLSGIFGSLFGGLAGFANGGSISLGGGNNKLDNQLVAFRASAGEQIDIHRGGASGAQNVNVRVTVDGDGNIVPVVERYARPVAIREARSAASEVASRVPSLTDARMDQREQRRTRALQPALSMGG